MLATLATRRKLEPPEALGEALRDSSISRSIRRFKEQVKEIDDARLWCPPPEVF